MVVASFGVDNRAEMREFLASRRAKLTPRTGRTARGRRQAAGTRAAPRGGRGAGRREHRLVHPPHAESSRFDEGAALWQWSVDHLEDFWESIWQYYDVWASAPYARVLAECKMPGAR